MGLVYQYKVGQLMSFIPFLHVFLGTQIKGPHWCPPLQTTRILWSAAFFHKIVP